MNLKAKIPKCIFLGFLIILLSTNLIANAATNGGKCAKVGQIQVTKGVSFVCLKLGGKTVWKVKPTTANNKTASTATTTTSSTSTTTTSVTKTQSFLAPTVASDALSTCEIQERSAHRITYPKGPYVGFPRRAINSFRNSGVLTYAMIPIEWADLQGNAKQLQESVKQANLFKTWMEEASQGRVQINWKIHPSWVRMAGASSSWYSPRAFPANVEFGDAAIAAADREFDFSNVDAVIYFLPESQEVFLEGSQGTVDSGLERPFRSVEGNIPSFAVMGKYFEQPHKNHWSAWVHYSLIWMGMPELFDAQTNRGGTRAIPTGNMSGFDIMSTQDGPSRQLSGWLRFLLDWLSAEQVYCKKFENISTIKLSLEPVSNQSTKLKMVGVRISDTKMVVIESRRLDKRFDCDQLKSTEVNGSIVYIVDSTQGHVTGETLSLVAPNNRALTWRDCNVPPQVDAIVRVGEFVDVLGLRIKVLESETYDLIEISRP